MAAGVAATAPAVFSWERAAYAWKPQRVRHLVVDPARLQPRCLRLGIHPSELGR